MGSRDVKIRNVGPKSAAWLRQVGVRTTEDLARVGPVETFLKVKRAGFRPSLNLLYSMAGALADCHWAELPDADKQGLIDALAAAESAHPIQTRWEKQKAASEHSGVVAAASPHATDEARDHDTHLQDDSADAADAGDGDRDLSRFD